jgi:hypothetical protein
MTKSASVKQSLRLISTRRFSVTPRFKSTEPFSSTEQFYPSKTITESSTFHESGSFTVIVELPDSSLPLESEISELDVLSRSEEFDRTSLLWDSEIENAALTVEESSVAGLWACVALLVATGTAFLIRSVYMENLKAQMLIARLEQKNKHDNSEEDENDQEYEEDEEED